jgi:hypothetical protein
VQLGDWFWLIVGIAVCAAMLWGARRIEPHWSAKDGSAFTCRYQSVGRSGEAIGSWNEGRAEVIGTTVMIHPKDILRRRPPTPPLRVISASDNPPKRRAVYLLDGDAQGLIALRVPSKSPANTRLAGMVTLH